MDKIIEDFFGLAQKNPLVAGILALIFGLYVVGKVESKTNSDAPTQPIEWKEVILAQNENIADLTELVKQLIEERNSK